MEIKCKCKYDYKTCKAFARAVAYKKQNPKKLLMLQVIFALIAGITDFYLIMTTGGDFFNIIILIACVFIVIFDLFVYFGLPYLQYRSMSKMKDFENNYIFRENEFVASTNSDDFIGDSVMKYSMLEKVMETKEFFFLFQNKRQALIVDKSTLSADESEKLRDTIRPILGKKYIVCKY